MRIANYTGIIEIAMLKVPSVVLDDGMRLFIKSDFLQLLGIPEDDKKISDGQLLFLLTANHIKSYIDDDLINLCIPIEFRMNDGALNYGYPIKLLIRLCNIVIEASIDIDLTPEHTHILNRCECIMSYLALKGSKTLMIWPNGSIKINMDDE